MHHRLMVLIPFLITACAAPLIADGERMREAMVVSAAVPHARQDGVAIGGPIPTATAPSSQPVEQPTARIIVEAADSQKIAVTEEIPDLVDFSRSPRAFRVQFLDDATGDATFSIVVADPEDTYTLSRSQRVDESEPPLWRVTEVTKAHADSRVKVPIRENGRYLLVGRERLDIPQGAQYALGNRVSTDIIAKEFNSDMPSASANVQSLLSVSIPPEDRVVGDKAVLSLLHGAGSERFEPSYLLGEYAEYLTADGKVKEEVARKYIVIFFRYDSRKTPDANAKNLRKAILERFGPRIVIPQGHSMGGHVARAYYDLGYPDDGCPGFVTMGTAHNGSPLSVLEQMYATLSGLAYPTLKTTLYTIAMSSTQGGIRPSGALPLLKEFAGDISRLINEGLLTQASFEDEFGIPSSSYSINFSVGLATFPLRGMVSPESNLVVAESACELCRDPQVASAIRWRTVYGVRYCNYIEALQQLERIKGCDKVPHAIAHAGYLTGEDSFRASSELLSRAQKPADLVQLANNLSYEINQGLLSWVWTDIFPAIPTSRGRTTFLGDGFVLVQSALGLLFGDPIDQPGSSERDPQPDMGTIRKRLPAWIDSFYVWRHFSHQDMTSGQRGKNKEFLATLLANADMLESRARLRQKIRPSSAQFGEIRAKIRKYYAKDREYISYGSDSYGSFKRYYKASLDESSLAFEDVGSPDKLVAYRVRARFRVRQWSWKEYSFEPWPIDQDSVVSFSEELSSVGNRWYFRRSQP